jgi:phage terminase large subunit
VEELQFNFQPKQKVFYETVRQTPIVLFGGARGGGKSKAARDIMLHRRFEFSGTHGGLFRRTYKELEGNHIRPIFKEYPMLKQYWNDSKKLLSLPNGSTLEFCHAENENDVDLYQGREFEDLAIEEAGQWTEAMFRKLLGSNRSSKQGFRSRCLLTGNPGGIGHTWLKRLFIERRFSALERPADYAFIQALVDDNPALIANDPDYVHKLNSEPNEALRKAWRYGDWDIFAGQYFGEIRREVHFIDPFAIPLHWLKFGAYDFGFNHPAAFGWFASDSDGNVFMYRELVRSQMRVDQFATEIKRFADTSELTSVPAGLDCWTKRNVINERSPPTIAEEFAKHEIFLSRATVDRVQGASQLRNYLAWQNLASGRTKPRLFIFKTCPITFDCISRMQHDPDHLEDVLKVDATDGDPMSGDDAYDMLRYALMSRPPLSDEPRAKHKVGTPEYDAQFARELEEHHVTQLVKERENRDGQGMNWDKDANGVPEWNRWTD